MHLDEMIHQPPKILLILIILLPGLLFASTVKLQRSEAGIWQLIRDGVPFYVMGAGGDGSKVLLASCGANTIRTWGVDDDLQQTLDEAQALNLAVIVGHWLGHERHGFDYHNPQMLQEQKDRVSRDVLRFKDHPALLIWGLGNEMEGIGEADDPALWTHIQDLAAMVKELDPDHPTMTVTADIGGQRVPMIHELCPDIDIVGINTYGGLPSIPRRYREAGGFKPYLITEFGPPGVWETALIDFGVPPELSSTQKGIVYADNFHHGCLQEHELSLGGCAFFWGAKPEATATWFGMLLPSGEKLAAVDAMTQIWSGKPPANLCPEIISFKLEGRGTYMPDEKVKANLHARDPEAASLTVHWKVYPEAPEYLTFGETWWQPLELGGIIQKSSLDSAELCMPGAGLYRLYVTVFDGAGAAATANLPFRVLGETRVPKLKLPLFVYADGAPNPWAPSGWMGDYTALRINLESREQPHQGSTSLEVRLEPSTSWAGVAWQDPPQDWGEQPGGYDLSGAKRLSFWARGRFGGEKVSFGVGLLGSDVLYPDSDTAILKNVKLTDKWKRYQIKLKGKDLSRLKTPFWWSMTGSRGSQVFYLDDIAFE